MRSFAIGSVFLAAGILSICLPSTVLAQETPGVLTFDNNGNGQIDPEEVTPEFLIWVNRVLMPVPESVLQKVQVDGEMVQPESAAVATVEQSEPGEKDGEPAPEAATAKILRQILLRRNVEEVSLTKSTASLGAADGAIVSYTNDVRQDTEEWQVQGALLYPIRYETGREGVPGNLTLSAYTFVPSASFDRKFHSADADSEVDSLVFRLGSEWEVSGGRMFPRQYFRATPVYGTDFGLESAVVAAEFQYEVLQEKWGLGAPRTCLLARFKCQWRAILHVEGGKTIDAGDKTGLVDDEEFLRAGPKFNITVQPTFSPIERLELKTAWLYLEDLLNDGGATDLFESGISWRLDDNGHLRLRAQYRHGDLPLTRDKISIVTTGLEIKF